MKIIFLEIDGVLNSEQYFMDNCDNINRYISEYEKLSYKDAIIMEKLLEIDVNSLYLLIELINKTNAKVVITSSWKYLQYFKKICDKLKEYGVPIIGITNDEGFNRGLGIRNYIENNKIKKYIIIDDDIFPDYDEELLEHLVKTSFYDGGLNEELMNYAVSKLNTNVFTKKRKKY